MAGYTVYTVSTTTWGDRQIVDPADCPWARARNSSAGGISAAFKLGDPNVAAVYQAGAIDPIDRCLVIDYDGTVVYAGIIWEDTYDRNSKTLTISHEDIWSVMALRMIAGDRTSNMPRWEQTIGPFQYDTIVKRLVQWGTSGAGRTIPIRFEDDYYGPHSRTYNGYNAESVMDAITEIMNLPGGPNIDFRPQWTAEKTLEWTLRTGDLSLNTIEVDFAAPLSAVRGLTVKRSGRERATQVFGIGEGSGGDMLVRPAGGPGNFALERAEQAKNIKVGSQLSDFAAGELSARAGLIRQYGFDIELGSPRIGNMWEIRPGTLVRWHIVGDPAIRPDGWRTNAVLKYSGGIKSRWLHLEFQ